MLLIDSIVQFKISRRSSRSSLDHSSFAHESILLLDYTKFFLNLSIDANIPSAAAFDFIFALKLIRLSTLKRADWAG